MVESVKEKMGIEKSKALACNFNKARATAIIGDVRKNKDASRLNLGMVG